MYGGLLISPHADVSLKRAGADLTSWFHYREFAMHLIVFKRSCKNGSVSVCHDTMPVFLVIFELAHVGCPVGFNQLAFSVPICILVLSFIIRWHLVLFS